MKSNFDACMKIIFAHEGGYVNHPRDPGGETNMGITKRSYPKEDIRGMTKVRAAQIYRRDFWDAVRGDDLPAGLDLVAFDAAVNSGVSRGAKWVQSAVGAKMDGKIGPATIAAALAMDRADSVRRACAARMAFLRSLKTWDAFGKGWARRVSETEAAALEMAAKVPAGKSAPSPVPAKPTSPSTGRKSGLAAILALIIAAVAAWFGLK